MQQQQVLSIFLSSSNPPERKKVVSKLAVTAAMAYPEASGKISLRVGDGGQETHQVYRMKACGLGSMHGTMGGGGREGDVTQRNSFLAASNLTPREASAINRRAAACGQSEERGREVV